MDNVFPVDRWASRLEADLNARRYPGPTHDAMTDELGDRVAAIVVEHLCWTLLNRCEAGLVELEA